MAMEKCTKQANVPHALNPSETQLSSFDDKNNKYNENKYCNAFIQKRRFQRAAEWTRSQLYTLTLHWEA